MFQNQPEVAVTRNGDKYRARASQYDDDFCLYAQAYGESHDREMAIRFAIRALPAAIEREARADNPAYW